MFLARELPPRLSECFPVDDIGKPTCHLPRSYSCISIERHFSPLLPSTNITMHPAVISVNVSTVAFATKTLAIAVAAIESSTSSSVTYAFNFPSFGAHPPLELHSKIDDHVFQGKRQRASHYPVGSHLPVQVLYMI